MRKPLGKKMKTLKFTQGFPHEELWRFLMRKPSKCKIPKISLMGKLMGKPLENSGIHTPGAVSKGLPHEENLENDKKQIPAELTQGDNSWELKKMDSIMFSMDSKCFPD